MSFSSMWVGATGIKAMSQGMNVIGNNIANSSTVGFKNSEFNFANLMSQDYLSPAAGTVGYSQVGKGVRLNAVTVDRSQGSLQTTNIPTNLAIEGKGYFKVVNPKDSSAFYTRAGDFQFDQSGYLLDPNGNRVQGQNIVNDVNGATTDIRLNLDPTTGQVVMNPVATTAVTSVSNLSSGSYASNAVNPFFAMAGLWNASNAGGLSSSNYAYANGIKVYDQNGNSRTLNIYYDQVPASNANGKTYWEFAVGVDPSQDMRTGISSSAKAGLLMIGTMTFDSAGTMESMSAFTYAAGTDAASLSNWAPATFSATGYPEITAAFPSGATSTMSMDFGLKNTGTGWTGGASNAARVGTASGNLPTFSGTREAKAMTNYGGSASTGYQSQNGYAKGYIQDLLVDGTGLASGLFSNGATMNLFQVRLFAFTSDYGLRSEGNNLYGATSAAGTITEGNAGSDVFGQVKQNALETSNTDLAREFVNMITTQRGFEAQTKVITTSDSMLQTAISMKH